MEKHILILAGPSGGGKTTVTRELLVRDPSFLFLRSITTRKPRGDGQDEEYLYLSREEFEKRLAAGEVLEWMEYGGNLYGTPVSEVERAFSLGKTPLLILDITGVGSVKAVPRPWKTLAVYLYESLDAVEQRLYDRALAKDATIEKFLDFEKRRQANIADYLSLPEVADRFDAFVRNDEVARAAAEILSVKEELLSGKTFDCSETARALAAEAEEKRKPKR